MKPIVLSFGLELSSSLTSSQQLFDSVDSITVHVQIGSTRRGMRRAAGDAYRALAACYQSGDRIVLLGAGKGAYCACGVAKALGTVGLMAPDHHLFDYAVEHWLAPAVSRTDGDWLRLSQLAAQLADTAPVPIAYLGLWNAVKPVGMHSISCVSLPTVRTGRHALAVESPRCERLSRTAGSRIDEVWFPGEYRDIVGLPSGDPTLAAPVVEWVIDGIRQVGIPCRETTPRLPSRRPRPALPRRFWTRRPSLPEGALIHASVRTHAAADPDYWRRLPDQITWVDTGWPASRERLSDDSVHNNMVGTTPELSEAS